MIFLDKKLVLLIAVIIPIFGILFFPTPLLVDEFSDNREINTAKISDDTPDSKNEQSASTENPSDENRVAENNQADIPAKTEKTQTVLGFIDPPGQLVHHLYNINDVPSPKALAFSPNGKEIWITMLMNKKRGAAVFDSTTGENLKNINLAGNGGVELIFSRDGEKIYVSQMETNKVFEIDVSSREILRTFDTKGAWTKFLALSPDGKTLYASNWSDNNVSVIDLETGETIRLINTVKTPRGLFATKDGSYLYVAGFGDGEIQKINLKTGTSTIIYKSGGAMRHIVADEEKEVLFVSDMGKMSVWQVDLKNDSVKKFAATDHNPNTIAFSPDKKILFVSCRGLNASAGNYYTPGPEWGSVLLFDTESGKMLDAIIGGNQPTALDISPDGKYLAFSDFLDSKIEVFEIPPYETLKNGNGGRSSIYKSELHK